MTRVKEAWDAIYKKNPMSAQKLKNNAARFCKDKSLLNLIEAREDEDVEPNVIQEIISEQDIIEDNVDL